MNRYDVLIVGSGHAGAQAAIALRQNNFAGSVALIGKEAAPPYERPPLSKEYLAGEKPFERMLIRPLAFWAERAIDLLSRREVTGVDAPAHELLCANGDRFGYRTLIWAAGGAPRQLSCLGSDLEGVHSLRSREDVDRMRTELPQVTRVAVVGGGYVGLEAAAVLTKLGKQVIVLEAQDRVLARVAGEPLSAFYEAAHRAHGVDVRLGIEVACIEGRDGRACGVRLADGGLVAAEMVIVGIGIAPVVAPLLAAGAAASDGIEVDEYCRTTLPDIYAVGDCAAHPNPYARGARIRLESVQNASDQATTAVRHILGQPQPYHALPWFWSNQYDLKLQTIGLSAGHDRTVLRGAPATRSFSLIYFRGGAVIALDCVNAVKDYVQGRALIGRAVDPGALADPAIPLKALAGSEPVPS